MASYQLWGFFDLQLSKSCWVYGRNEQFGINVKQWVQISGASSLHRPFLCSTVPWRFYPPHTILFPIPTSSTQWDLQILFGFPLPVQWNVIWKLTPGRKLGSSDGSFCFLFSRLTVFTYLFSMPENSFLSYILFSFLVVYGELVSVALVTVSYLEDIYWFDFGFDLYSNNLFILNM